MAQLSINQCQTCGKILAPGVTECGKCHTKHSLQPTIVNPLRFSAAEAAEYRAQFQEQVEACPKDSNAQFAMGLTYLGLHNYELADEHFVKAVQLTPSNPDVYYYTALSMFHHRSVMNLSKAEMGRIEEWLHTAVQMQPKRKYLILQMILRQGMSSMGINVDTDKLSPAELMKQARVTAQEEDELHEIEQHVLITDEKTLFLINKLSNVSDNSGENNGSPLLDSMMDSYENFCQNPRDDDNGTSAERIKSLESEEVRRNFFSHIHEPQKPQRVDKPGYIGPIFTSIWKAALAFVVWLICGFIAGVLDWTGSYPSHVDTVEERIAQLDTKKLSRKEIAEAYERAQAAYECDSAKDAQMTRLFYHYEDTLEENHYFLPTISEEELAELPEQPKYFGIKKGWRGYAGLALWLLPLLYWLIATIARIWSRARERKEIDALNTRNMQQYECDQNAFKQRPSISDYKVFCSLFAGPNDTSIIKKGDFVREALRQARISERDIQNGNGKIFFSCYMMDLDDNGKDCSNPAVTLRDVVVRVCVAMRDSIIYMHAVWDSASDEIPIFDQERLLYAQIANFRNVASYSTLEVISHSNSVLAKIIYAYGNYPTLFPYQSLDPDDELTYSTTRTSDFDEFYNSLVKMHTAYIKS